MTVFDAPVFDCDNHYYEALDAFTRHLDPAWGPRTIQWAEIDGRRYHVVAGRVSRAVVNPTFDPVAEPGVLRDYFRGNPNGDDPIELLRARTPIRAAYRDRDARIDEMDAQGVDRAWLFPTLGMIYEDPLRDDPEAVCVLFEAFNRWVAEDWGFAYADRIFAAPYLTLADPRWAEREATWAVESGARVIVMRPAAPTTAAGRRPPTAPEFDRFWSLIEEAGITVVVHAGDSGYSANGYADDGFTTNFSGGIPRPIKLLQTERPIEDFLASLIADNLFVRHPRLRIASVENGSGFLRGLFHRLDALGTKMQGWFSADPVETFREHIWINPFWEDDIDEVLELMGSDRVIFGSDWPHIEGMPRPLDYLDDVAHLDATTLTKVMSANTSGLNAPPA
ncbi:MAG: amidohydrolase family protein [Actinobacteria bacterium]|nr:amidohydrolase family protein [Actinomycetota bacterium]